MKVFGQYQIISEISETNVLSIRSTLHNHWLIFAAALPTMISELFFRQTNTARHMQKMKGSSCLMSRDMLTASEVINMQS